jgi:hypothetical protein
MLCEVVFDQHAVTTGEKEKFDAVFSFIRSCGNLGKRVVELQRESEILAKLTHKLEQHNEMWKACGKLADRSQRIRRTSVNFREFIEQLQTGVAKASG